MTPTKFLLAAAVSVTLVLPEIAAASIPAVDGLTTVPTVQADDGSYQTARRGRGGDDSAGDDSRDRTREDRGSRTRPSRDRSDDRNGGGRRPRTPGGSGCDDAGDIAEHPECRI